MKRKVALALAVIMIVTAFSGCSGEALSGTSSQATLAAIAEDGEGLMAGAGIAQITPTSDMYPISWGGGNRAFAFIGAIEHVYARVIAVSNAGDDVTPENTMLIVSVETGRGPNVADFIPFISNETGVPEDNIFWSTTHVHSVPEITSGNWGTDPDAEINFEDFLDQYEDEEAAEAAYLSAVSARNKNRWGIMVQKQLVEAAQTAIDEMRPAEVALGTTESYINVNRDTTYDEYDTTLEGYNGQGFADKTLTVIEFRERQANAEGTKEPIAFIVHYALHNVMMYANDYFNPSFFEPYGITEATDEDIDVGTYVRDDIENTVLSEKIELNVAYSQTFTKHERSMKDLDVNKDTEHVVAANAGIHPDIGGLVSQYIEREFEDSVALWVSGAAGDINPLYRNTLNFESPYTGEVLEIPIEGGKVEPAEYYAAIQYNDVLNALDEMWEEDNYASYTPIGINYGYDYVEAIEGYNDVAISMTVLRLGDITLAGTPAEVYNAIGVAARDGAQLDAPSEYTLFINHSSTNKPVNGSGYQPDDVAIGNNSYNWGSGVKYPQGVINDAYIKLIEAVYSEIDPE